MTLAAAAPDAAVDPVRELAAVERALAAASVRGGFNPALQAFIADDGVIFRPEPVNGKQWLQTAEPNPGTLDWWPEHVEVSCDAKLGWSTGPVTRDGRVPQSHYVTIWERQPDGEWRFIFDQGNPHVPEAQVHPRTSPPTSFSREYCPTRKSAGAAGATADLFAADAALSEAQRRDSVAAFGTYLAPNTRLHRWGKAPVHGKPAALDLLRAEPPLVPGKRLGGKAAASGDLGFTYGDVEWTEPRRGPQKGYYFRIWRKTGDQWQLALEQVRPLTPPPPPAPAASPPANTN